ncbi:hypothetical protein G4B88_004282 [Cannabis sativa]|uniref:RNase H type-1 domain-containing protein n=1 Tax=Cannabis sativa TaxID=3483 RepID=A0A7J6EBP9_CANSA|nr:hypothetical protein G4B88_004282 [Cannabis sativa]
MFELKNEVDFQDYRDPLETVVRGNLIPWENTMSKQELKQQKVDYQVAQAISPCSSPLDSFAQNSTTPTQQVPSAHSLQHVQYTLQGASTSLFVEAQALLEGIHWCLATRILLGSIEFDCQQLITRINNHWEENLVLSSVVQLIKKSLSSFLILFYITSLEFRTPQRITTLEKHSSKIRI